MNNSSSPTRGHVFVTPLNIALTVLGVLIISINGIVIFLFWKESGLRKSVLNIFLLNMAISDCLFGALILPTAMACAALHGEICIANSVFIIVADLTSIYHIVFGIIEKYLAICHTMWHRANFTRTLAVKMSLPVWFCSMVMAVAPVWWLHISKNHFDRDGKRYAYIYMIVGFIIPVLTSAILYTSIVISIRQQSKMTDALSSQTAMKQTKWLRKEQRVALIFAGWFTLFLACFSPWFIFRSFHFFIPIRLDVVRITVIARYSSTIVNPLFYTFIKPDYRQALMKLFGISTSRRNTGAANPRPAKRERQHLNTAV